MASLDKVGLAHLWSGIKTKLNTKSDVGHKHSFNELNDKPNILQPATGGYNGAVTVGTDGVTEMGKYIDFHNSSGSSTDFSTRFMCTGEHGNVVSLPSTSGTIVVGDNAYKIVKSSSAPTVNDTSVITVVI